ncbi:DUF6703 family protein [Solwaraspora sp. WMMB335]|uniref:DUF6703 family protein n=1 Tax=Solwaraspora sp. WMMB335 TaxID=3404118 RepID=UPI003B95C6CE
MQPTQPPGPSGAGRTNRRISPTGAFLVALVLVLAGLFVPGAGGGLALLVLAAGLAWLLRITWPVLAAAGRLLRLLALTLLIAAALAKIT